MYIRTYKRETGKVREETDRDGTVTGQSLSRDNVRSLGEVRAETQITYNTGQRKDIYRAWIGQSLSRDGVLS